MEKILYPDVHTSAMVELDSQKISQDLSTFNDVDDKFLSVVAQSHDYRRSEARSWSWTVFRVAYTPYSVVDGNDEGF